MSDRVLITFIVSAFAMITTVIVTAMLAGVSL